MRLLIDTHVFLWCLLDDRKLKKADRALILDAEVVYVSSASVWEIAIKKGLGKIKGDFDLSAVADAIEGSGFLELSVTAHHAAAVSDLPSIHRDPFDRLLIAQALSEPLILLTADKLLKEYSSALVRVI